MLRDTMLFGTVLGTSLSLDGLNSENHHHSHMYLQKSCLLTVAVFFFPRWSF